MRPGLPVYVFEQPTACIHHSRRSLHTGAEELSTVTHNSNPPSPYRAQTSDVAYGTYGSEPPARYVSHCNRTIEAFLFVVVHGGSVSGRGRR